MKEVSIAITKLSICNVPVCYGTRSVAVVARVAETICRGSHPPLLQNAPEYDWLDDVQQSQRDAWSSGYLVVKLHLLQLGRTVVGRGTATYFGRRGSRPFMKCRAM